MLSSSFESRKRASNDEVGRTRELFALAAGAPFVGGMGIKFLKVVYMPSVRCRMTAFWGKGVVNWSNWHRGQYLRGLLLSFSTYALAQVLQSVQCRLQFQQQLPLAFSHGFLHPHPHNDTINPRDTG